MIEANELRIGNLVSISPKDSPDWLIESYLTKENLIAFLRGYTIITPIVITPEWLLKLGFTRSSSKTELWSYGNTMLIWRTEYESDLLDNYYEFRFGITSSYGAHRQVRLDHVHELQNLTLVLTGEELTVKEAVA